MAKRIGGARRKTRHKLKRSKQEKGKISISAMFREYAVGDNVVLTPNSAVQDGVFCFNFTGRHAIVIGKQGKCYQVLVKDGGKEKKLIVHPVHLTRAKA
jgi:large subunit ribosomal protein L21e